MMDDAGQRIRKLTGGVRFDRNTSNEIGEFQTQCKRRNLEGKCAVPGVLDEFGQNMSQEEFAKHKAAGTNPFTAWENSRMRQPQWIGGQMQAHGLPPTPFRGGR
jgi:hypothetical protein